VVIGGQPSAAAAAAERARLTPWYERLWQSVEQANRGSAR
jgi:hypothetical protein